MSDVGIVLLAAGRGARFGSEPKLLADLAGRPLIRHAAEAAAASGLGPIVAVVGAHGPAIRDALAGLDLLVVDNPDFGDGLASSLRVGLAALPDHVEGAVVMLGDMPRITPGHLKRLADAFRGADPRPGAVIPVSGGRRGNPALLNRRLLAPALATLAGDEGAGRLLAQRTDVLEIAMDAAVAMDIDTPEALAEIAPK